MKVEQGGPTVYCPLDLDPEYPFIIFFGGGN